MDLPDAQDTAGSRPVWTPPAEGAPRARVRLLGDAIAFACPGMQNTTVRHSATVLCATGEQPLRVVCDGQVVQGQVLLIRPMARKTIHAVGQPLVLIDLEPTHPQYRRFHAVSAPGAQALDASNCAALLGMAQAFGAGQLGGRDLDASARHAIDSLVSRLLPAPAPLDARVRRLMSLLDEDPSAELDQMARQLDLSPHHASRLFGQGLGLPLRRYALSVKIRAAASFMGSGLALTAVAQAAGFVDSAHFSKVWVQCYGASPSHFFHAGDLHIDAADQPDWLLWYLARRDRDLPPPRSDAQTPWVHRRSAQGGRPRAHRSG
ncbi:MAG: AraC family transcriptional regulator [Acidovorax sp.]|nr:AraC family transcriptional regulator [Acidovorax sp.]